MCNKCVVLYSNVWHFEIAGDLVLLRKKKKSAESSVAPAGIKSHKFLFELKKIYFAVFKRLMG